MIFVDKDVLFDYAYKFSVGVIRTSTLFFVIHLNRYYTCDIIELELLTSFYYLESSLRE